MVTTAEGSEYRYDALISTLPLDILARMTGRAARLTHSTVHVVGIGVRGELPEHLRTRNWIYFPEGNCPFYRVTVLSNYSPANAPAGHWSLLAEVSASEFRPAREGAVVDETIAGFRNTGLLPADAEVVSTWRYRADYGYPTPTLDRDAIADPLLADLERHDVYSRGRFGAWKYEIGNQDHSFMQGVEAANRILSGEPETTVWAHTARPFSTTEPFTIRKAEAGSPATARG
jgi:protoporphyrinogen oxidase